MCRNNKSQLEVYTRKRLEKTIRGNIEKEKLLHTMVELKSRALSPKQRELMLKETDMNVKVLGPPKKKKTAEEEENA